MGIRIIGTGSSLPPQVVGNDQLLGFLKVRNPKGGYITGDWVERKFGIRERHFDFNFGLGLKNPLEKGGIFDVDLALEATTRALENAGREVSELDSIVYVSCTPDEDTRCGQHVRRLVRELQQRGLRREADVDHENLGCAGVAAGLRRARAQIKSGYAQLVAVVASNCTSSQLVRDRYVPENPRPGLEWAWLSPVVFGDGAGALILSNDGPEEEGLRAVSFETHPEIELVRFPAGGGRNPTRLDNVDQHVYVMDPEAVGRVFAELMPRNIALLEERTGIKITEFDRIYVHQANGPAIKRFVNLAGLPPDKVPINIDRYGNTSAASTLLLLHEDRLAGLVGKGAGRVGKRSKVAFLWIGAGIGAMNGYAAFIL